MPKALAHERVSSSFILLYKRNGRQQVYAKEEESLPLYLKVAKIDVPLSKLENALLA